ncbi:hypothetical protein ACQP3J_28705, partial [Escherichia coli]
DYFVKQSLFNKCLKAYPLIPHLSSLLLGQFKKIGRKHNQVWQMILNKILSGLRIKLQDDVFRSANACI